MAVSIPLQHLFLLNADALSALVTETETVHKTCKCRFNLLVFADGEAVGFFLQKLTMTLELLIQMLTMR